MTNMLKRLIPATALALVGLLLMPTQSSLAKSSLSSLINAIPSSVTNSVINAIPSSVLDSIPPSVINEIENVVQQVSQAPEIKDIVNKVEDLISDAVTSPVIRDIAKQLGKWTVQTGSSPRPYAAIASSSDGTVLVKVEFPGDIYTSRDSGKTWNAQTTVDRFWKSVTTSFDGRLQAAVAANGNIFTSNDYGDNWVSRTSVNRFWSSITSSADGRYLAAAESYGKIFTSNDFGETWISRTSASQIWSSITSSADGKRLAAAVTGGRIWTTEDFGVTWGDSESPARAWVSVTSSDYGNIMAAVEANGKIYTSTDGGATWQERTSVKKIWKSIVANADGSVLAAVEGVKGKIWTSIDAGLTWIAQEAAGQRDWTAIAINGLGDTLAAVGNGVRVWSGEIPVPTGYNVIFDEQQGSPIDDVTFTEGGTVQTPSTTERPGYTFMGWSATNGGSTITFPYSPGVTEDITLYAKWDAKSHTVTFDSLGGTPVSEQSFVTGGTVAAPTPPTRSGYTFVGWAESSIASALTFPYSPDETDDITLYALWSSNSNTVTFNSKGGSPVGAGSFASGGSIDFPSSTVRLFDDSSVAGFQTMPVPVPVQLHLGNKYSTSQSGWVKKVYYYRFSGDDSAISASVWSSAGALLGSQLFASGTESGWQSVTLTEPVYIAENETFYVTALTPSTPFMVGLSEMVPSVSPLNLIGYAGSYSLESFDSLVVEGLSTLVDLEFESQSVPTPTRAGYTFLGWSATDGGSVISFPYTPGVIGDITLYANWSKLNYDVTFDSKSGTSVTDGVFETDGSFEAPTSPTRAGYTFLGWSATDGGSAISFPYAPGVTEDITLYALWSADSHTVTFDSKGGDDVDFDSFVTGGSLSEPFAPTRDGYGFVGWSATDGGAAISFPYAPGVISDITLYALWSSDSYTATFNSMGGDDVDDRSFGTGGSFSAPTIPTRTGYTFLGWSDTDGGSAVSFPYAPGVLEDITLYALWSANSHTVTFESFGNPVSSGSFDTDGTLDAPSNPTVTGYTFLGWTDTPGGSAITFPYAPDVTENITLYALWSADSHTVTFNSNQGTPVTDGSFVTDGTLDAPSDPSRAGYTFLGWSATEGGSLISFPYHPFVTEDFTLYAVWSADSHSVTFNSNQGTPVTDGSFETEGAVTAPADPTRSGYSFVGWSATNGGDLISFPYAPGVIEDITLHALWSANSHSVTFNSNQGSPVTDGSFVTDGSLAEPDVPTRNGYTFLGWSATNVGNIISFPYAPGVIEDITLYAVWSADSQMVYLYSLGVYVGSTTFYTDGLLNVPFAPRRNGYTFQGWSLTDGGSAISFPYSPGVANSIDLYALWSADSHSVTFNSNEGTPVSSGSFVTDGAVTAPSDPLRAGYTFLGWSATDGGSAITFPYAPGVIEDITLYALWSANTYTVSFDSNGGSSVADTSFVTAGFSYLPAAPSRPGYTFLGWSTLDGGVVSSPYTPGVIQNITLYARWAAKTYVVSFDEKGGTGVSDASFVTGGSLAAPSDPSRFGYTFLGWSATDGGSPISWPYFPGVTSNITLYALWSPEVHNIWFLSDGSIAHYLSYVTDGFVAAPSDPVRAGYTFRGWSATDGGSAVSFPYYPGGTGFKAMHALWSINTYAVTYDSKGGTSVGNASYLYGGSVDSAPRIPYRSGAVFKGWSATDGGDAVSFPYYPGVASNVTLYAKWSFLAPMLGTGSASTLAPGAALSIRVSRINEGCTVSVGWVQDNTGVSSVSQVVRSDRTTGVFTIDTPGTAGRYTLKTSRIGSECSNGTAVSLSKAFVVGKKSSVVSKLSTSSAFVSRNPVVTVSGKVKSGSVAVVGRAMTVSLRRNGVEVASATVTTNASGEFTSSFSDITYLAGEYSTVVTAVADSTYLASEGTANKLTLR